MLSAERKKTDKLELVKPLQTYIRNHYTSEAAQEHQEALNNLQQMREDVRNLQEKNEQVKDILLKYYSWVTSLELRFPITENNVRKLSDQSNLHLDPSQFHLVRFLQTEKNF